ncbi:MAG: acyl-CoA thioesterase [Bdellovibrio sp. CG12_big_fil_rev_8_21_14_0_65_39_13]|nr:MAG: acyl-CoA thioesterase [Bdellovibrio sp. CG22_combo_CG10-13_8_21_14_all_39_27]PIQ61314.1 MAG: acyl-CoA thioesterase [Bdellovibrio sp. CG12_big_fil_rev_8_21_14_0_65_39_13]PIR33624.1 MAG: acyl-CoA thioesterase [Bdellovibrio sp. CG11_big_fil_rev_8_21_14_0_20_39_38]PJB53752.1 MAG: acyl-CoA thioesterase [Bdellovibrio sp. CG_4_9_14_3_um_filter_39_7]
MNKIENKTPEESEVVMNMLVMPNDANPNGTIFGGVVMSWVDMCAAMVAQRHSGKNAVTVHIDDISFLAPIKIGDHVKIMGRVNYTGKSSMVIGVKVLSHNPKTGEERHTTTAYLTFVALDDIGRPTGVIPIKLVTEEDKRRHEESQIRSKKNQKKRS